MHVNSCKLQKKKKNAENITYLGLKIKMCNKCLYRILDNNNQARVIYFTLMEVAKDAMGVFDTILVGPLKLKSRQTGKYTNEIHM